MIKFFLRQRIWANAQCHAWWIYANAVVLYLQLSPVWQNSSTMTTVLVWFFFFFFVYVSFERGFHCWTVWYEGFQIVSPNKRNRNAVRWLLFDGVYSIVYEIYKYNKPYPFMLFLQSNVCKSSYCLALW